MAINEIKPQPDWQELLRVWNSTDSSFPAHKCLHELFEQQVLRTPNATALIFEKQSLTYAELNTRANQLATYLRRLGVGPDVLVGLYFERSLEMVVAIYATLKAGGAYVPIDPGYPADRICFMVEDAQCPVLLTHAEHWTSLPSTNAQVVRIDQEWSRIIEYSDREYSPVSVSPENLAYVIYTSGSTGKPKGVMNTHRGILNHTLWMLSEFGICDNDCTILKTPYSFDVSLWELFVPLACGAKLIIAKPDGHKDARYLKSLIDYHNVTLIHFVPSMLSIFLDEAGHEGCLSLKRIFCSGEALPEATRTETLRSFPGIALSDLYGPTEAAVHVSSMSWTSESLQTTTPTTIGRPVANTRLYVVNPELDLLPPGQEGELLIGGIQVARGYWNRPELTAEKFIVDHLSGTPNAQLYRTGDLCRWLENGTVEYLGRIDHQVKIRGFRIELGEVETAICEHPAVQSCVVIPDQPGTPQASLQAWLIRRTDDVSGVTTAAEFRAFLATRLPEYMIPNRFFDVDSFPLSPNGKLDRKALAEMKSRELPSGRAWRGAETTVEKEVLAVCEATLRRNNLSLLDHFFELGGHSLIAVMVASRLSKSLGRSISMQFVFQYPVLLDLAAAIEEIPDAPVESPIERLSRPQSGPAAFPASFGQQRMWTVQQMLAERSTYNVSVAWQLSSTEPLDGGNESSPTIANQIQKALRTLMNRHESLRTSFQHTEHELHQIVHPSNSVEVPWRESRARDASVRQTLTDLARQEFNLEQAPLWQADYVTCDDKPSILLLNFHHSIVDEWSIRLLTHELAALIHTASVQQHDAPLAQSSAHNTLIADSDNGQPLDVADAAVLERQQLTGERESQLREFWKAELSDLPDPLDLPTDEPRPAQPSGRGDQAEFALDEESVDRLRAIAREEETTLFTVMISAWFVWLYRYTHQSDLITGTPITTRNRTELHPIIGFMLNTVPVRTILQDGMSFREVVRQLKSTLMGVWQNSDYPFQRIVDQIPRERSADHQSLFRTMFVLLEDGFPTLQTADLTGIPIAVDTRTAKADLTLFVLHESGRWLCRWETSADLFESDRSKLMHEHWLQLLKSAALTPDTEVERLNIVTPNERRRVLVEWNLTTSAYPREKCIHELFEDYVRLTPDASALVWREQTLSYAELDQRAELIKLRIKSLIQNRGPRIGICMSRSSDAVASMLGILKAGGVYVPLDPKLPTSRLQLLIGNADLAGLIFTSDDLQAVERTIETMADSQWSRSAAGLPELWLAERAPGSQRVTDTESVTTIHSTTNETIQSAESPAYMIFTSGTTGDPKGVVVPHRGVVRLVVNNSYINLSASDRMLQLASLSFDASTFEIWGALLNGGCLVLMPTGQPSLEEIADVIHQSEISVLLFTTGLFHLIVDEKPEALAPLKTIVTGGDVLSPVHARRAITAFPQCRLVNAYGPTENSVITTTYPITPDSQFSTVPIGRPIRNTTVYLLDRNLEPVPAGVVGEIYTGGDGVGLSYFQDTDRTAQRFLMDPFIGEINGSTEPQLMYRTGDFARLRSDGQLEFRGRTDGQVKIRGFRIELGEVEDALRKLSAVRDACVRPAGDLPSRQFLEAVVILRSPPDCTLNTSSDSEPAGLAEPGSTVTASRSLRSQLAKCLPDYMIPGKFHFVESFPLTQSGKVDRRAVFAALPSDTMHPPGATHRTATNLIQGESGSDSDHSESPVSPLTELQQLLANLWMALLPGRQIGIRDHFFEIGGHSLLAVVMTSRLSGLLKVSIPVRIVFENPTIELLESAIQNLQQPTEGSESPTSPRRLTLRESVPASFSQQRFWFLHHVLENPAAYNVPAAWLFRDRDGGHIPEATWIRSALQVLMDRYEILRTSLHETGQGLVQQVSPVGKLSVAFTEHVVAFDQTTIAATLNEFIKSPFDLQAAPLWRAHWLTCRTAESPAEACLLLNFHHCIVDDWSIRILAEDLSALLSMPEGNSPKPALSSDESDAMQYLEFSAWEAEILNPRQLDSVQNYWRDRLSGASSDPGLPADAIRPTRASDAGAILCGNISNALVERLRLVAANENSTLFCVLMASWAAVLNRYSGQNDILIGVPYALRNNSAFSRSIGFFLNTVPVRVQVQNELTFKEFLSRLQMQVMDDFEHANLPLEQIIQLAENLRTSSSSSPVRTMLVVTEEAPPELITGNASGEWVPVDSAFSRSEITVRLVRSRSGWHTELEYSTELFNRATIEFLQQHLHQFLESIAENPAQTLQRIDFVPAPEKTRLLNEWNRSEEEYPEDFCLHQLFEQQAARSPHLIAVRDAHSGLTYSQLSLLSDRIAAELTHHGAKNDDMILICTRRSTAMIVGILGIMKSGAAWLPVDPDMPISRINRIIESAKPCLILTNRELASRFEGDSIPVLVVEDLLTNFDDSAGRQCTFNSSNPNNTAYVIYTSGSTGEPKGVMISHRNLVNYSTGIVKTLGLTSGMRSAAVSTLAADLAFTVVFPTLISGGELHVLSKEQALNATEMADYFRQNQIDVVKMVPSHLKSMLETSDALHREHIIPKKILVLGGESLQSGFVRMIQSVGPNCRIFNHYGPTETTVGVLANEVSRLDPVHFRRESLPLGYPLQNCQVYVVDSESRVAGVGVCGEIMIGGDCVGRGYLRSEQLTNERFVPDSLGSQPDATDSPKSIRHLYRTGDRGRVLPDGRIEFLGRVDHQIKVRGYRVELGEIDSALRQLPQLSEGVARFHTRVNGESELVAYVVAQSAAESALSATEIRAQLSRLIPEYMIPVRFIALPRLPLNLNGKIDRERLTPDAGRELGVRSESRPPRPGLESQIAAIWMRLLQRDSVGANDNFFEIGGHSLMSVRLVYALRQELGRALAISDIFEHPTIEDMAKYLGEDEQSPRKWTSLIPLQSKGSKLPLFCIHGWGGAVFGFIELAKHFAPDRPVYGLQAVGLEGEAPRHSTIEEMAAHYVKEIRMVQPHGPYNLAGYSMGGWIAFAVAQELVAQGETVGFLGLLDTHTSANVGWKIFLRTMWRPLILRAVQQLKHARTLPASQFAKFLVGRFQSLMQRLPGVKRRHTMRKPQAAAESASIGSSGDARSDYFFTVVGQYRPGVFRGNADILVTGEFPEFPYERFWKNFVAGSIRVHRVAGSHDRMIAGEFAAPAAELLERLMAESESRQSGHD